MTSFEKDEKYNNKGCKLGLKEEWCHAEHRACPHQRGDCEEERNMTYWLEEKTGERKSGELRSGFFLFLETLLRVTYRWLLLGLFFSILWPALFNEGGVTFAVDGSATGILVSFATFYLVIFWSSTDGKRSGGAKSYIGMVSGTKNIMSTLQAQINISVLSKRPMVKMSTHNGKEFEDVKMPAIAMFKRLAIVLNAIIVAQRNAMRSVVDVSQLPIYPDQAAQLNAQKYIDPIESLQSIALHYIILLFSSGSVVRDTKWTESFYKDEIDELGNLDVGSKIPVTESVLNFVNILLFAISVVIPLWFSRVYVGYSAVWISPVVLLFYYALAGFAKVQHKIAVTHAENIFTGIPLVEEMYTGGETNYARAAQIARMVGDSKKMKTMRTVEHGSAMAGKDRGKSVKKSSADVSITINAPTSASGTFNNNNDVSQPFSTSFNAFSSLNSNY